MEFCILRILLSVSHGKNSFLFTRYLCIIQNIRTKSQYLKENLNMFIDQCKYGVNLASFRKKSAGNFRVVRNMILITHSLFHSLVRNQIRLWRTLKMHKIWFNNVPDHSEGPQKPHYRGKTDYYFISKNFKIFF